MKNKILLLSVVLCALLSKSTMAQTKPLDLTFKVYGGYGVLQPGNDTQDASEFTTFASDGTPVSGSYKQVRYNLGKAPHFGVGISSKLTDQISVGIDVDYLSSNKKSGSFYDFTAYPNTLVTSSHALSLIPNISYDFFTQKKYTFYNTIGLVTAINTKLNVNYNILVNGVTRTDESNTIYKFGVNFGFKDAVGVKMELINGVKGFAEVSGFFLAISPKSSVGTSIGNTYFETYLHSGPTDDTVTGSTSIYNGTHTYDSPKQNPYHLSSIGVNIGVSIDLQKIIKPK